jgi:hypothetical protein
MTLTLLVLGVGALYALPNRSKSASNPLPCRRKAPFWGGASGRRGSLRLDQG